MNKSSNENQRGFTHVIAIVAAVVIIGALGYVGFRAMNNGKSIGDAAAENVARIAASKECMQEYDDKDLCKFISSWNINEKFKLESTTTSEGKTNTSTMTIDGDSSYYKMGGEFAMEMISIGDITYTKAGDTWWKQTAIKAQDTESAPSKDDFNFEEPKADTEDKDLTKYVKAGKEACGNLTCFKYQVIDPSNSDTTEYIWFDDKDYLIRRTLTQDTDGTKSDSVFSYENISVKAPSPVKELGPDQYIIPGQTEPQTMPDVPSDAEIEEMMNQYGQ